MTPKQFTAGLGKSLADQMIKAAGKREVSRQEFIESYGVPSQYKKPWGIKVGGNERYALPCACGAEACDGWAMVSAELASDHLMFYGPHRADSGQSEDV